MGTIALAWRNLWRNWIRTTVTASAISFSLALLLVTFGVADDSYRQMLDAAEEAVGGAVLVHHRGWWAERGAEQQVRDAYAVVSTVREVPGVRAVIPRVIALGLLSSPHGNQGAELRGIDPGAEASIRDLQRYLRQGALLDGSEERPLVLGERLAKDLGVDLGDRVVLTATGPDGEPTRALFRLTGVLGGVLHERAAFTTVAVAQRALRLQGAVTELGLLADPGVTASELQRRVAAKLAAREDLEVLAWEQAMPELLRLIEVDKEQGYIFGILVMLIVAFGIANTFLMSVMERVRELGLLNALGLTPGRIAGLVLSESLVLAVVAGGVGLLLALVVHLLLSGYGVDLTALTGGKLEMAGVTLEQYRLRSTLVPARWIGGTAGVVALVLLSTLYPAQRAARLDPAQAMRTYE